MKSSQRTAKFDPKNPQPLELDDVNLAFPAFVVGTLLPDEKEIPEQFWRLNNPWNNLFNTWFYDGLPETVVFHARSGFDGKKAYRHVAACMRSWEPKHQHKEAGCAWLMSLFFEKVVIPAGDNKPERVWSDGGFPR